MLRDRPGRQRRYRPAHGRVAGLAGLSAGTKCLRASLQPPSRYHKHGLHALRSVRPSCSNFGGDSAGLT